MPLRIRTAAGSLALLLTLGGCGIGEDLSERPPEQIVNDARASAHNASSVHVTGSVTQDGTENKLNIVLTNDGDGMDELSAGGQTISVIKVDNTIYAKGLPGTPGPDYVQLPANDPQTAELSKAVDKKKFLDEILGTSQKFTLAGKGKVGDQDTLKLTTDSGKSILHVADDTDDPYPMRIEGGSGPGAVSITFSEWNEDAKITAPKTSN
ncbi:MAG TPA: hypothetical protein VHH34_07515 [Pseudonocardiaceae bacterium]|nr:hypothetical protein [Pseudonocardiaceae bacterium]